MDAYTLRRLLLAAEFLSAPWHERADRPWPALACARAMLSGGAGRPLEQARRESDMARQRRRRHAPLDRAGRRRRHALHIWRARPLPTRSLTSHASLRPIARRIALAAN